MITNLGLVLSRLNRMEKRYPSIDVIAELTGVHRATVARTLHKLRTSTGHLPVSTLQQIADGLNESIVIVFQGAGASPPDATADLNEDTTEANMDDI